MMRVIVMVIVVLQIGQCEMLISYYSFYRLFRVAIKGKLYVLGQGSSISLY